MSGSRRLYDASKHQSKIGDLENGAGSVARHTQQQRVVEGVRIGLQCERIARLDSKQSKHSKFLNPVVVQPPAKADRSREFRAG